MSNFELARNAAIEASSALAVGDFISEVNEAEEHVTTYLFDSKLKGYVGWRWSVSIFQADGQPTISEVNLIAGEQSVLAPQWVPWSERLADYKALQAALEQQAAEEAAAAAEEISADDKVENADDTDEDDGFEEVEEIGVDDVESQSLGENSAPAVGDEQAEQAESNADDASGNPPSFFRIFRRNKKRK